MKIYQNSSISTRVFPRNVPTDWLIDTTFTKSVFLNWCGKSYYVGYVISPPASHFTSSLITSRWCSGHAWVGVARQLSARQKQSRNLTGGIIVRMRECPGEDFTRKISLLVVYRIVFTPVTIINKDTCECPGNQLPRASVLRVRMRARETSSLCACACLEAGEIGSHFLTVTLRAVVTSQPKRKHLKTRLIKNQFVCE